MGPQVRLPWTVSDPPGLSPFAQSLDSESPPYVTARPIETETEIETTPAVIPDEPVRRRLDAPDPVIGGSGSGTPRGGPDLGSAVPDRAGSQPNLSLLIEVPESVPVDEFVPVRLNIENTKNWIRSVILERSVRHINLYADIRGLMNFDSQYVGADNELIGRQADFFRPYGVRYRLGSHGIERDGAGRHTQS